MDSKYVYSRPEMMELKERIAQRHNIELLGDIKSRTDGYYKSKKSPSVTKWNYDTED